MKRNTQRQGGFTLVELLVVITIIGMLMALLLPAVNAAVEQVRNLTCKNNMRNMATGCIDFEATNGRFPGYNERVEGTNNALNEEFINGWTMAILPQLDHIDWYEEFRRQKHSEGSAFAFGSDLFVCPSNPPTTGLAGWSAFCINAGYWDPYGVNGKPAVTSLNPYGLEYAANGIAHDAALEKKDVASAPNDGLPPDTSLAVVTTMDSISDGASYTVLVSENVNQTSGTERYWWQSGKIGTTMVWHELYGPPSTSTEPDPDDPALRLINNRGTYSSLQGVPLNLNTARPSSFHTGGVNMAFCDGRVIFVRETIAYRVYQHLMTTAGRESNLPNDVKITPLSDQEYQ